ncbi:MAG: hypothetical protein PHI12_13440 [Dehalococcoidales bacterium]|jgi:hypothetical protein|nr:hypothetical protein [Dehalococcoidales bacterium]
MIIQSIKDLGYAKRRPKAHKLENITTKTNPGFVIAAYPRPYPKTSQQKKVADAAKSCGIKKGMSRGALVTAMRTCIPDKF